MTQKNYDFSEMDCMFTVEKIRKKTKERLSELDKTWNEMQVDILVQGVENSDWLKLPEADDDQLLGEINEWIGMLEEEWKENGEYGY